MVPLQFELGPLALVGPITVGLGPTALSSSPKNVEWPSVESIFFPLLWLRKKCRIRKMLHRHFFLFVIKEKVSSQKKNEKLWPKNVNLQFENESEIFLMFQTILNMNVTISYSMMNIYSMRMKQGTQKVHCRALFCPILERKQTSAKLKYTIYHPSKVGKEGGGL